MDGSLLTLIILLSFLLSVFIILLAITENRNSERLKRHMNDGSWAYSFISLPSEKAISYQKTRVFVWVISLIVGVLLPAFLLFSGFTVKIADLSGSISKSGVIADGLYFAVYSLISTVLEFPLSYYWGYKVKHVYGLSEQSFSKWIGDLLKGFAISTLIGSAFIWVPYEIMKKSPGHWWLYVGLLSIPVLSFLTYAAPVFLDPIFNKYCPVKDNELEEKIHELLARTVIRDCKVYQVNKSVDTKEMNAYMTGVFNTKRIVLWDTTIDKLSQREVLSVTAHEMGHYLVNHIWKSIILGGILCIVLLNIVDRAALWVIKGYSGILGFHNIYDISSFPLFTLLGGILMFILSPFINLWYRYNEREADRFQLELTRDNEAAASVMKKLHENSLILPDPGIIFKLWNYSHPTFRERVEFALNYKPWEKNMDIKYKRYIIKE